MRIAFSNQLRARPYWNAGPVLSRCHHVRPCLQLLCSRASPSHLISEPPHGRAIPRRLFHGDTSKLKRFSRPSDETRNQRKDREEVKREAPGRRRSKYQLDQHVGNPAQLSWEERQNPETWVRLIEEHITSHSKADSKGNDEQTIAPRLSDASCSHILSLLNLGRKASNAGVDILAHMIFHSHRKSAIWLCENLLRGLVTRRPLRPTDLPPSNIVWPDMKLNRLTRRSIEPDSLSYGPTDPIDDLESSVSDPRYSSSMNALKDSTMDQIWTTLGAVVAKAADMGEEEAQNALNAVQLILGHIHNLDLVPDNVYSYNPSTIPTTIQRPPIIHLLSSRILSALSDATWRDQQYESIEKAASHGLSYKEIGRDPPGGRFRLKVHPLDPEVWLEFILWCCVEGGYMGAGGRIVKLLQQNTQNPWFAITWSGGSTVDTTAHIDWNRVRSRTGGTVGRLEGYSKVKPLAEVPPRTISTEVVLALVEGHVDAIQRTKNSNGMNPEAAQVGIVQLISFLEPHDLPVSYFDYISSRLLTTEAFDIDHSKLLKKWADRLSLLKTLEPVRQPPSPHASFQLDAVSTHSEFYAGVLHQVLDSFVQEGNIHDALRTFNEIQKLVDNSKLHAISSFLQGLTAPDKELISAQTVDGYLDFVKSHGQLPLYRLAGLLNLATDTNLIGFGQWLIYNEDPDGPLIRKSAYNTSGVSRALVRFAALSNDHQLLNAVSSGSRLQRLPTVGFLRTSLNARLSILDAEGAWKVAKQLKRAQGGGLGLSNLAHLAGIILKIEYDVFFVPSVTKEALLTKTRTLLTAILSGDLDGRAGVLQHDVARIYRQQVSHLLTILERFPESSISAIAKEHRHRFQASNIPNLSPSIFNTFLEAVAEVKGPFESIGLIETFCTLAGEHEEVSTKQVLPGDYIGSNEPDAEGDWNEISLVTIAGGVEPILNATPTQLSQPSIRDTPPDGSLTPFKLSPTQSFIPFVQPQSVMTDDITEDAGLADKTRSREADKSAKNQNEESDVTLVEPGRSLGTEGIFKSPFFPDEEVVTIPDTQSEKNAEIVANSDSDINNTSPVCIHDIRTIRLIVRSINQLTQRPVDASQAVSRAPQPLAQAQRTKALSWARRKFIELGCTANMISNEIREPTAEVQILEETRSKNSSTNTAKRAKKVRMSRISRGFGGARNVRGIEHQDY